MSTYPVAFDSTFPGYPYVDNTQFIDQTQANAWVQAIQNIETAVGYGTGGTAASPLYSAAYATTYSTMTARISALEGNVVNNSVKLNTSAGNIQSVGASNQAGSTGLAADAGHIHAGQSAATLVNIGTIFMWPASSASFPSGALQCNGQLISTATYSTLFGIISYNYGGAGGSFALPNFNDRFPIGVNSTAPSAGSTGGSTTITQANLPAHNHGASVTDSGHRHASYLDEDGAGYQGIYTTAVVSTLSLPPLYPGGTAASYSPSGPGQQHWASATTGISVSTGTIGSGAAYTPPYLGIYFLIRAI
jgi:microcystin-dependent protein